MLHNVIGSEVIKLVIRRLKLLDLFGIINVFDPSLKVPDDVLVV